MKQPCIARLVEWQIPIVLSTVTLWLLVLLSRKNRSKRLAFCPKVEDVIRRLSHADTWHCCVTPSWVTVWYIPCMHFRDWSKLDLWWPDIIIVCPEILICIEFKSLNCLCNWTTQWIREEVIKEGDPGGKNWTEACWWGEGREGKSSYLLLGFREFFLCFHQHRFHFQRSLFSLLPLTVDHF